MHTRTILLVGLSTGLLLATACSGDDKWNQDTSGVEADTDTDTDADTDTDTDADTDTDTDADTDTDTDTDTGGAYDPSGVYEGEGTLLIDMEAVDADGNVLLTTTCEGDITVDVDGTREPQVTGLGTCSFSALGYDVSGRGTLEGSLTSDTTAEGTITLLVDTEEVTEPWTATFAGDTVTGEFTGTLPFEYGGDSYSINYDGTFTATR